MKQSIINLAKKTIPFDIRVVVRKLNWRRLYFQQNFLRKFDREKVYCPIANQEFPTFIKQGSDLITPTNGAKRRQRLVWHYLVNELNLLSAPLKVLHTAPEYAFMEILKHQPNLSYTPGDKMETGYSNQKGVTPIDLTDLEFEEHTFDYVISNHVLEHIPDDQKAISEMFRVLKPGGSSIITVPIKESLDTTYEDFSIVSPRDRKKHFGQWDHVRWYALDIQSRFEEAKFEVEMIRYGDRFSPEAYTKFGFCDDLILVAKKPIS